MLTIFETCSKLKIQIKTVTLLYSPYSLEIKVNKDTIEEIVLTPCGSLYINMIIRNSTSVINQVPIHYLTTESQTVYSY